MGVHNDKSRCTISKIKIYGIFGLCSLDGYVETSETLGRHYQLRAWGISSYSKALAEKRTTSGMEEDGIFQNKWY